MLDAADATTVDYSVKELCYSGAAVAPWPGPATTTTKYRQRYFPSTTYGSFIILYSNK